LKIKSPLPIWLLALCFTTSMFPAKLRDFHYKKISPSRALIVTIKRSSPPMALIEDMHMSVNEVSRGGSLRLEPLSVPEIKPQGIRVLAGLKITKRDLAPKIPDNYVKTVEDIKAAQDSETKMVRYTEEQVSEAEFYPEQLGHGQVDRFEKSYKMARDLVEPESESKSSQPRSWVTSVLRKPDQPTDGQNSLRFKSSDSSARNNNPSAAPPDTKDSFVTINGQVGITGVGFTGTDSLVVFREMNGRKIEEGLVNFDKGEFSIRSTEARGFLIAQVLDESGQVKGAGEVWLNRYSSNTQSLSGLKIEVTPKTQGFSGTASSAYSTDASEDPVLGAKIKHDSSLRSASTNKIGRFEIRGIHPRSSVVLTAEKKGYWNSLVLTSVRHRAAVTMYPESMIAALHQVVARDFGLKVSDIKNGGIVWGRVLKGRTPLSGAKVEAAGSQGIGPIYFNSLHLPDTKLEATSNNGLFVFLNVPLGTQSMRAQVDGRYLPAKIFPVEDRHVTPIEISTGGKTLGIVQSFDSFTKEPVATSVRFAAASKTVRTNGEGTIRLSVAKSEEPLFIESEASGDYLPIRMSFDRGQRVYAMPQVRDAWLNGLQINRAPGTGMVVGFIGGKRFDVFLDVNGKPHNEVYYFNSSGTITPMPVADGGFIIANVPNGMRTVSLVPEGSDEIFHQVLSVDEDYLSVVSEQFNK
jgi:hypothetical protein